MNRDELLKRAIEEYQGANEADSATRATASAVMGILCILLAREQDDVRVMDSAKSEAEQMVAAQMEEEKTPFILPTTQVNSISRWYEYYNNRHGDSVNEAIMQDIRRLTDSHRAANARIAELEEAIKRHQRATAAMWPYPDASDSALYEVLDKR